MFFPVFSRNPPPLHFACATGDPRLVQQVLESNSAPEPFDDCQLSPYHYACSIRTNVYSYPLELFVAFIHTYLGTSKRKGSCYNSQVEFGRSSVAHASMNALVRKGGTSHE